MNATAEQIRTAVEPCGCEASLAAERLLCDVLDRLVSPVMDRAADQVLADRIAEYFDSLEAGARERERMSLTTILRRLFGRPLPRVFALGDPMGCNGCDAVTKPLTRHTNGGWYCPSCSEEVSDLFGIGRAR